MREFREFKFQWTYGYAETVRGVVVEGRNGLVDVRWFLECLEDIFYNLILKPHKKTLLHYLIEELFLSEMNYLLKKCGEEAYPEIYELLKAYNVHYENYDDFSHIDDPINYKHLQYRDYIIGLLKEHVLDNFVEEVFTITYQDKALLVEFNKIIADFLIQKEHARGDVFRVPGVVHRYVKWPMWLRKGIYFRDKGRCGICLSDLSGELAVCNKLAIDHIVPLNLGGTNDPINLQQLCSECNGSKGGHTVTAKNYIALYW